MFFVRKALLLQMSKNLKKNINFLSWGGGCDPLNLWWWALMICEVVIHSLYVRPCRVTYAYLSINLYPSSDGRTPLSISFHQLTKICMCVNEFFYRVQPEKILKFKNTTSYIDKKMLNFSRNNKGKKIFY